jgi:hypothetical protein
MGPRILKLGTRWKWVVSFSLRSLLPSRKHSLVAIDYEAGWASELVWTFRMCWLVSRIRMKWQIQVENLLLTAQVEGYTSVLFLRFIYCNFMYKFVVYPWLQIVQFHCCFVQGSKCHRSVLFIVSVCIVNENTTTCSVRWNVLRVLSQELLGCAWKSFYLHYLFIFYIYVCTPKVCSVC